MKPCCIFQQTETFIVQVLQVHLFHKGTCLTCRHANAIEGFSLLMDMKCFSLDISFSSRKKKRNTFTFKIIKCKDASVLGKPLQMSSDIQNKCIKVVYVSSHLIMYMYIYNLYTQIILNLVVASTEIQPQSSSGNTKGGMNIRKLCHHKRFNSYESTRFSLS